MREALQEAQNAQALNEVPVGAVLWDSGSGQILGRGYNQCISAQDPTAHAEILALREAGTTRGNYRLQNTVLVVTLEPCLMCLGALVQARIAGLVYGARDPKAGAVLSSIDTLDFAWLYNKFWIVENVLEPECKALLRDFFHPKRNI